MRCHTRNLFRLVFAQSCLFLLSCSWIFAEVSELTAILEDVQDSEFPLEVALQRIRSTVPSAKPSKSSEPDQLEQLGVEFVKLVSGEWKIDHDGNASDTVETVFSFEDTERFIVVSRLRETRDVPRTIDGVEYSFIASTSIAVANLKDILPQIMILPGENGICRLVVGYADPQSKSLVKSLYTERHEPSPSGENKITEGDRVVLFYSVLETSDQSRLLELWQELVTRSSGVTTDNHAKE